MQAGNKKSNYARIELPRNGQLPQNLKQYIHLSSNACIELICEPLKLLHIDYFLYVKRFKDGSSIYLTNKPDWQLTYFEQYYYLISDFDDPDKHYANGMFLWSSLKEQEIYQALRNQFGIDHGITISKVYEDCTEFFHFGANQNYNIINFYLNQFDALKRFMSYFKDKAWELIETISASRIILPKRQSTSFSALELMQSSLNLFQELTACDRYYVSNTRSDIYLTKREMECLHWYSRGKSADEIGTILSLSKRTVESHLLNSKNKINYYKKNQFAFEWVGEFIG